MKFSIKDQALSQSKINELKNNYETKTENNIIRHALSKSKISDICYISEAEKDTDSKFSIELKTMSVCNQKQSGRCWIFAGLNILREKVAEKLNLKSFELSQNYIAFYDKLEKLNYALSSVMELIDHQHDERTLAYILTNGIGDGGQWDMFANLVKKYGVCPKKAMVETAQSSGTRESDQLLNSLLRFFASEAQSLYKQNKIQEIQALKDQCLQKGYNLLANCFSKPVEVFDFEYVDNDGKYHCEKNLTPLSFYDKYLKGTIEQYQSITNSPTEDKPYLQAYTIAYLGNVIEGRQVTHLNLSMERMEELIISQLKDNQPVWFGSDVSYYGDRQNGRWDTKAFDYLSTFDIDMKFDKAKMLDYYQSAMNHAMVITGVNLVDNKPTKWKIENSWGDDVGEKGYYVMSEEFFKTFVYQAVINKKYLNKDELEALEKEIKVYPCYDPMGTLAK